MSKKKKRKCGFCMKLVRGHNIRTCPLKLGQTGTESEKTTDDDIDELNEEETEDETNEEDTDEDL